MTNRATEFMWSLSAGVVASATSSVLALSAAGVSESCLTSPKGVSPPGQHWYYRVERGTGRHCWVLRDKAEAASRPARSTSFRRAKRPATDTSEAATAADARAEMRLPQTLTAEDLQVPSQAQPVPTAGPGDVQPSPPAPASVDAQPSLVAGRWPDPAEAVPSADRPSLPVLLAAAETGASAESNVAPIPAPRASTANVEVAEPLPTNMLGSFQTLILVTFGAFAFSALTTGTTYLVVRPRRRSDGDEGVFDPEPEWPPADASDRELPSWLQPVAPDSSRRPARIRDGDGHHWIT